MNRYLGKFFEFYGAFLSFSKKNFTIPETSCRFFFWPLQFLHFLDVLFNAFSSRILQWVFSGYFRTLPTFTDFFFVILVHFNFSSFSSIFKHSFFFKFPQHSRNFIYCISVSKFYLRWINLRHFGPSHTTFSTVFQNSDFSNFFSSNFRQFFFFAKFFTWVLEIYFLSGPIFRHFPLFLHILIFFATAYFSASSDFPFFNSFAEFS